MRKGLCTLAILVAIAVPRLSAQTATGSLVGRVTDPTGAVVTGVEITVTNPVKGFTSRTTSGEQGIYRFLYLEPATYNLTFSHAGFNALNRPGVILRSAETVTVDAELTVGSVSEKIEVTSSTPLLETATSTTGATLKEASSALRKAGAKKVVGVVVARG